jgi:hypothetical protein
MKMNTIVALPELHWRHKDDGQSPKPTLKQEAFLLKHKEKEKTTIKQKQILNP